MNDDKVLVQLFLKDKSEKAFGALYHAKTPHLYQMALRLTGNDVSVSEEIIQEMWVVAIRKLGSFEWKSTLKTWLTGILLNLARERWRHQTNNEMVTEDLKSGELESFEWNIYTRMDLEKCLASLPPGYRQVIVLHDIEGYRHKEIAEMLAINEGTSKSQLYHARRAMRAYLNELNGQEN